MSGSQKTFWNQRQVCVTGGAGFLGSFVVEKLKARVRMYSSHYRRIRFDTNGFNQENVRCIQTGPCHSSGCSGRRDRCQPGTPGGFFL